MAALKNLGCTLIFCVHLEISDDTCSVRCRLSICCVSVDLVALTLTLGQAAIEMYKIISILMEIIVKRQWAYRPQSLSGYFNKYCINETVLEIEPLHLQIYILVHSLNLCGHMGDVIIHNKRKG